MIGIAQIIFSIKRFDVDPFERLPRKIVGRTAPQLFFSEAAPCGGLGHGYVSMLRNGRRKEVR